MRAARATQLEYELTGALGRRTKFQQTDVTQLILLAQSRVRGDGTDPRQDTDTDADGRSASHIRCWQMPNRPGERGISVQTLTCVRDLPYVISTQ